MKTSIRNLLTIGLVAAFTIGSAVSIHAEEKNAKAAKAEKAEKSEKATSDRKMPFNGKVAEIDKAAKTVKIGKRTFHITDQSEITKDGKKAILDDAKVGEISGGSYQDKDGKLQIVKIRFGPKPTEEGATAG